MQHPDKLKMRTTDQILFRLLGSLSLASCVL